MSAPAAGAAVRDAVLSERQQNLLQALWEYIAQHGYSPSTRDLQDACDITSTSVVDYNLTRLWEAGLITRERGGIRVSRSLALTRRGLEMLGVKAPADDEPPEQDALERVVRAGRALLRLHTERGYPLGLEGPVLALGLALDALDAAERWCSVCDRELVEAGARCPHCHATAWATEKGAA